MSERLNVMGFIVRHMVLPTAPEDAQPFEGETTQDGLVALARPLLLAVVGLRPRTFGHGLSGPFDEGLSQKLRGIPAPMGPDLPAAFFTHRGDTTVFLDAGGGGIALPVGAEGHEQPWRQCGTGPRQVGKQRGLGMNGKERGNARFHRFDLRLQGAQHRDQQLDLQDGRCDHDAVGGERPGLRDQFQAAFNDVGPAAVMRGVEVAQGFRPGPLELRQFGPAFEEVQGQRGPQVSAAQGQRLRVHGLQSALQLTGKRGAPVNGSASDLGQSRQFAGGRRVELQRSQLRAVLLQDGQQHQGIGLIVLRSRRSKRFAEAFARRRMYGINRQPGIAGQGMQDRIAPGFNRQGHRLVATALSEFFQPAVQRFGRCRQPVWFDGAVTQLLRHRVFLVSPVHGHGGHIINRVHGGFGFVMEARAADCIVRDVDNVGSQRMHDRTIMLTGRGRDLVRVPAKKETRHMFVLRPASKLTADAPPPKMSLPDISPVARSGFTPVLDFREPGPNHVGTPIQSPQTTPGSSAALRV